MGQMGFCKILWFPAVFCENRRFHAVFCKDLRLRKAVIPRRSENLRIWLLFAPPHLVCPFLIPLNFWAMPPVRLGLSGRNSGKYSGNTPETLSERFLEFPSRVRLGCPKPYNSRHSRLPEHFQNSLPPSTAGDASFFRSGSGEGHPEPVMEFPAVLGVSLNFGRPFIRT